MTNEKLYEVLGDIRGDYVKEAAEYRRPKRLPRRRWGAAAACLCLVVGLAIPMLYHATSDGAPHSGLRNVREPVYDVVAYAAPASYEPSALYIATTADLAEYDAHMAEHCGERFRGKGVRVFTFAEGAAADGYNVWYFDYAGAGISRIYYTAKSGGKLVTAWSEAGELGRAVEALACETSADTPMYLAQDEEILYAVIGKTAYCLPGTVMRPAVSQLPAIDTEGLDTVVIAHTA